MIGSKIGAELGGFTEESLNNYSLSVNVGSFILDGETAQAGSGIGIGIGPSIGGGDYLGPGETEFDITYVLSSNTGTFIVTGQNVDFLTTNVTMPADTGTFIVTGQNASLLSSLVLTAETGTFIVTGLDDTFNTSLPADQGTFIETGNSAELLHHYVLNSVRGVFTEIGMPANMLRQSRMLIADKKRSKFLVRGNESIDFQFGRAIIKLNRKTTSIIIDRSLPHFLRQI